MPYSCTVQNLSLSYEVMNDTNTHLTDTTRWYEIKGEYTAKGGEQWITIGHFIRAAGMPTPIGKRGVSVASLTALSDIRIFPNPARDVLHVGALSSVDGSKTIIFAREHLVPGTANSSNIIAERGARSHRTSQRLILALA